MKNFELIPINLSFFDAGEKTEKPTPKRRREARNKGQVAYSPELSTALLFLVAFFSLRIFTEFMVNKLISIFTFNFNIAYDLDNIFNLTYISGYISNLFLQAILITLPVIIACLIVGVISSIAQVGWNPTSKPLKPKFSKLNPISGIKRLFSLKVLFDLCKALIKFFIIGLVIYTTIKREIEYIPFFINMGLLNAVTYVAGVCFRVGINVGILFLFIALADIIYTRYTHTKKLRMSKQDVKEEYKNIEGNPQIRSKIKQKMREMSMRRMMQDIPSADVIITNPTHYAVAIKYDANVDAAPIVVAKGIDFLAKRIKEMAKENNIYIMENKPLARALYSAVDVGKPIPPELYQGVAEALAFVYNLKKN